MHYLPNAVEMAFDCEKDNDLQELLRKAKPRNEVLYGTKLHSSLATGMTKRWGAAKKIYGEYKAARERKNKLNVQVND
jgi:hypothetical protein